VSASAIETKQVPHVLVECVQAGVIETFQQIFGVVSVTGSDVMNGSCDGVVGIISFMGTLPCSLILAFPSETITAMAHKFCGFEIEYDSADMLDMTGELVNVLAGPVSARLVAAGLQANMSLPTVARGYHIEMVLPGAHADHRLHFSTDQGPFRVKIAAPPVR
jgi:CheY-specific phosphatase CheX